MNTTLLAAIIAPIVSAIAGFGWGRLSARPRDPETDVEHADALHERARDFNITMHNARAAGLNPTLVFAPIDDELDAGSRPIIAGLQRGTVAILRTLHQPLNPPDLGCTLPPPGWYCTREPGHEGACPTRQR